MIKANKEFKIGSNLVGQGHPVFIIAEAGVNHNGKLETALELVKAAKKTGANCIKFQTYKTDRIVTKGAPKADYQNSVTDKNQSQYEMLKELELDYNDYYKIIDYCNKLNIQFLSTPYNIEDADFLNTLGVDAFKVASGQIVETPFLKKLASYKKPIILSTGMATLSEVYNAYNAILEEGNRQVIILQCTTNYPASNSEANIRAMKAMGTALDTLYGYSDHIPSNYACYASVALGGVVIEKHFTLDRTMNGPDHSSSLDIDGFKTLVNGIRMIEEAMGSIMKKPTASEVNNTEGMRRSIVTLKEMQKGEIISEENVGFKRPATGIPPKNLSDIIGKSLSTNVKADTPLQYDMIKW